MPYLDILVLLRTIFDHHHMKWDKSVSGIFLLISYNLLIVQVPEKMDI
ncbi:unnamed protein product [Brugia timori]|uniref:Uncharacterized protein n=1 Tax=Brugia timori TaxID=42155 RepID=A0A0R3QGE8_9BILA|nr:unnamed protein product [Brugia timori]